jgi:POT family proton-dependent oligopeptide transporter
MTTAEATPAIHLPEHDAPPHDRAFLGHPKGLGFLSLVEGCERFSYYSMQTLLVLYMVKYLLLPQHMGAVAGLGWLGAHWYTGLSGQPLASAIFGDYTALVYLTPILGGIIADRWLGRRSALVAGALVMALGHFLMAFEGSFLFALLALVTGVGLFKGNIASQVGELYRDGDVRRAMAFQIFYIAIQVSVIAAPLVSGTLGEEVGWHWGFGCAGVVMVVGLLIYLSASRYLPPDNRPVKGAARAARDPLTRTDWLRILAVLLLVPVMCAALLINQEIFNAYLVWADEHFNRMLPGWMAAIQWHVHLSMLGFLFDQIIKLPNPFPTSWMITLDATFSFVTLVGVTAFWDGYGKRRKEPDELSKMIIGCGFMVVGAGCLVIAAGTQGHGKIGLFWPVLFHLFNSIGFGHVLPVSLALFSRLAPRQIAGTVIGIYYLAFFGANKLVGIVGGWYSTMDPVPFWTIHLATTAGALVAFALFRLFLAPRLLHAGNPEDVALA